MTENKEQGIISKMESELSDIDISISEKTIQAITVLKGEGVTREKVVSLGQFSQEEIDKVYGDKTRGIPTGSFKAPDENVEPSPEDKALFFEMIKKIKENQTKINRLKQEIELLKEEEEGSNENNNVNIITNIEPEEIISNEVENNRKLDLAEIDKKISELNINDPLYEVRKDNLEKERESINDYYNNYGKLEKKITENEPSKQSVEVKKDIEQLTPEKLKIEIEKVIKKFADKLKKNNIAYKDLDINKKGKGFNIVAHLEGTGWKSFLIGNPNFIADIQSEDGKIVIPYHKLEANDLVSSLTPKKDIDNLANTLGEEIKKYIEGDRKKEVERIDIENGVLKITYK
jgi:hypothetical protein